MPPLPPSSVKAPTCVSRANHFESGVDSAHSLVIPWPVATLISQEPRGMANGRVYYVMVPEDAVLRCCAVQNSSKLGMTVTPIWGSKKDKKVKGFGSIPVGSAVLSPRDTKSQTSLEWLVCH